MQLSMISCVIGSCLYYNLNEWDPLTIETGIQPAVNGS